MDRAKVRIDANVSVEAQMDGIIKQLQAVLPMNFEKMKIQIPHGSRLWYPELKAWKIHHDYFDIFYQLLGEYFRNKIFNQHELF